MNTLAAAAPNLAAGVANEVALVGANPAWAVDTAWWLATSSTSMVVNLLFNAATLWFGFSFTGKVVSIGAIIIWHLVFTALSEKSSNPLMRGFAYVLAFPSGMTLHLLSFVVGVSLDVSVSYAVTKIVEVGENPTTALLSVFSSHITQVAMLLMLFHQLVFSIAYWVDLKSSTLAGHKCTKLPTWSVECLVVCGWLFGFGGGSDGGGVGDKRSMEISTSLDRLRTGILALAGSSKAKAEFEAQVNKLLHEFASAIADSKNAKTTTTTAGKLTTTAAKTTDLKATDVKLMLSQFSMMNLK
jgi:hypothetical protein